MYVSVFKAFGQVQFGAAVYGSNRSAALELQHSEQLSNSVVQESEMPCSLPTME